MLQSFRKITIFVVFCLPAVLFAQDVVDQIFLHVTEASPQPNETSASVNAIITATFDRGINASSLDSSTIVVYGEKAGRLRGFLAYNPTVRTVYFLPSQPLLAGDHITVILTPGIMSTDGYHLKYGYVWNFEVQLYQGIGDFDLSTTKIDLELTSVATGDFDQDGQYDVAVTGKKDKRYYLQLLYYRNGLFEPGDRLELPHTVRPMYVADINGDGLPDFVLIHRDTQALFTVRAFSICFLKPDGHIVLNQTFEIGKPNTEPRSATINDFNGDGFLDVIVAKRMRNQTDGKTILVYLNDGAGNLGEDGRETDWFWSDRNAENIFSRDFNFNGHIDVGVTGQGFNPLSIFINPGNGWQFSDNPDVSYGIPQGFLLVDYEKSLSVDFTGDLRPDIAAADLRSNNVFLYRYQAVANGRPEFAPAQAFAAQPSPYWIQYGDMDADGDHDLVTAGDNSNIITLLKNDGTGDFSQTQQFNVLRSSSLFTVGDINGDAAMDICLVSSDGTLTYLQNKVEGNSPPEAPLLQTPTSQQFINTLSPTFQWQVPADANGDALHFQLTITKLDSNSQGPVVYDSAINPELFNPTPPVAQGYGTVTCQISLPDQGEYSWNVAAFDGMVIGPASQTHTFRVDVTAPSDLQLTVPEAVYDSHWLDLPVGTNIAVDLHYSEENPDSAILKTDGLGGPYVQTSIPAGNNQQVTFAVNADNADDGRYDILGQVIDLASNRSDASSWIGIDRNPPVGTTAHVLNDTSSSELIYVSWSGGNDGQGSGLSGYYSVQVKVNDGPWTLWLDKTTTTDTTYQGEDKKSYAFEAAAYDHLGHFEGFANVAEATVFVDTTADDETAPGKPRNLMANGSNPSPWQSGNQFEVNWENPPDESGISKSYWKLGSLPTTNSDYDASNGPQGPVIVNVTDTGRFPLYLWLEDGNGNVDYQNNSSVILRRDAVSPVIEHITLENPSPLYTNADGVNWYNLSRTEQFDCRVTYTETFADRADLDTDGLAGVLTNTDIPDGQSVETIFSVDASAATEGIVTLTSTILDSAANSDSANVQVGFDGTSPHGCVASAPEVSTTEQFTVSWSAGDDGTGSGISGRYDVYVRVNGQTWINWLMDVAARESTFTGAHGNQYEFEAICKDHVGNLEELLGQAEATVQVDTTADDVEPPAAPINLTANGSAPSSPWSTSPDFEINWQNPDDESGVVKSLYKLGAAPVSNYDTTGSGPAVGPMTVSLQDQGRVWLYVWLVDKQGNVDFHNTSRVLLRYDNVAPVVNGMKFVQPEPPYTDDENRCWYNQKTDANFTVRVAYSEIFPERAVLQRPQLGPDQSQAPIPAGDNVFVDFPENVHDSVDGGYSLTAIVYDSAGQSGSQQALLGLDSTPPQGAVAQGPDTSATLSFDVSWTQGEDVGSGLSGSYDLYYQIDEGPWLPWVINFQGLSNTFTGQHGHTYGFEALARDHVGNIEAPAHIAEATVLVDTLANDKTPPPPPIHLQSGGSNPSPWQNRPEFIVTWEEPDDESGIARSLWKLRAAPISDYDTTGSGSPAGPLEIHVDDEGETPLYVWLVDGHGNTDYHNNASILLRYDKKEPQITRAAIVNPKPPYRDTQGRAWYNQSQVAACTVLIEYDESQADSVILRRPGLGAPLIEANPPSGDDAAVKFLVPLAQASDGSYVLTAFVIDVAGKVDSARIYLGLDRTPPENIVASGPRVSTTELFTVNWSAGSDMGSGLSGRYRVMVKKDNNPWDVWLTETSALSDTFMGVHNHTYYFEATGWDHVGNQEPLTQIAEATVFVDTTADDVQPPAPPINLMANGANPSTWSQNPAFHITWQLPYDESGIAKAFYKIGAVPQNNDDYTAIIKPDQPFDLTVDEEGSTPFYLWLADGHDNVDYRNYAVVKLRYDKTLPSISQFALTDPGYGTQWYNPRMTQTAHGQLIYTEDRTDSLIVVSEALGLRYVNRDPQSGVDVKIPIAIDISEASDGSYDIFAAIVDSAGNMQTKSLVLKIDQSPPFGAKAVSVDTSSELKFIVSWGGANDSNGVGLSGKYDVRYRIPGGGWRNWLLEYEGESAEFPFGQQGGLYYFEAAAWDRLKNREYFLSTPETSTFVDTTAHDLSAPPPPINLRADGSDPSPWKKIADFLLTWEVPDDPSGVVRSYFKLGDAPTSNSDTTGSAGPGGPISVRATLEGGQWVYVWLADGRGNKSYQNASRVLLRYDKTPPVIHTSHFINAGYAPYWFNPAAQDSAILAINYQERFVDSIRVRNDSLGINLLLNDAIGGVDVTQNISLDIAGKPDGTYPLTVTVQDSAGNNTTVIDTIKLDSQPPSGTVATSPDTSSQTTFVVSWVRGSDNNGVGLSDTVDVRVKIDGADWQEWLQKYSGVSASFVGKHGHSYQFEAAAYDLLGNREPFTGQAESKTVVDTTAVDLTPPAAPVNLLASGSNPSPWQKSPIFEIKWTEPQEPSGIIKSWYKLNEPPTARDDTTATASGIPPIEIEASREDGQMLYLWLEDSRHNVDFRNYAATQLRWDATPPRIDSLVLTEAMYGNRWFNPGIIHNTRLKAYYTEKRLMSLDLIADSTLSADANFGRQDSAGLTIFALTFPDSADTTFLLKFVLEDSAANMTIDSTFLSLDSSPPSGTTVTAPDTTGPGEFTVMWGDADDGGGSGISGTYDVRLKIDNENWQPWRTRFKGTQAILVGEVNHVYAFEAAAYDNVGNREAFAGIPEATTVIDTSFSDVTAPASPKNLTANGNNPSPWSSAPEFELNWENPIDPSGIARALYKIGSPPQSAADTTGSVSASPPVSIVSENEGESILYLWLQDGRGNADFHTADSVLLRYDATPPQIDSLVVANAQYLHKWINPDSAAEARIRIYYHEQYPDTARLLTGAIQGELISTRFSSQVPPFVEFTLSLVDLVDGCYPLSFILSDSAGHTATDSLQLCVDASAPVNAKAVSPAISLSNEFTVSWSGENQGSDENGSGLSGAYDVRIRIDQGAWFNWLEKERRLSANYVGVHGHSYSFEVAAWDRVGNREPFLGQAETTTRIDTAFVDETPPAAPSNVMANEQNPSPWQNSPTFTISWENPIDPSGITHVYYKLGEEPRANDDTTGVASADKPLHITVTQEYGQMLYLWLDDGKGNADFHNHAAVLLRYDATPPEVDSLRALAPGLPPNWYNQKKGKAIRIRVYFKEKFPASVSLSNPILPEVLFEGDSLVNRQDSVDVPLKIADALDGAYWITVAIEDSAGNRSEPDSILINLDGTPPEIRYQPTHTVIAEGEPFHVQATVTDENRVEVVRLQYWKGGSRFKESLDMAAVNDSTFTATIDGNEVTARGLNFAIWAGDGLSLVRKPSMTENVSSGYFVKVRVVGAEQQGLERPEPFIYGSEENAYRMISFPVEIEDPAPSAVLADNLGPYDIKRWRFFYWNTLADRFNEYPETGALLPGRAYWLITSIKDVIIDTGPGVCVDASDAFIIPLRKGWNDIGNPFDFDIEWRDIFIASAVDTQKIMGPYTFRKKWLLPFEVNNMQPWEGYSIYTEFDDISLAIPPLEARRALHKRYRLDILKDVIWAFCIGARADSAADASNFFGCSERATNSWDYGFDFVEPPQMGKYISLYFPHSFKELKADRFATDFRAPGNGDIWDFEIISNKRNTEAVLTFHPVKEPPQGMGLTLVDTEARISVDMLKDTTYSFWLPAPNTVRHFQIYAGNEQFMATHESDIPVLPDESVLIQNYPNPFNSSTMICYNLKEDGDVKISIYNLLAQRIKLIHSGYQRKGFYQYRWDARDENGNEVGTGIYLIRLETPNYKATRKMVYMR